MRKNMGIAMPLMGRDLGITKEKLGLFLTLHGVIYGVSKFLNGFLADRSNACVFMSTALLASALLNVWFGLSSTVVAFGIIWMLNGWFQGMGFPPCARLMANWFPPKELATKFSIWNSSHNIGSIGIVLLCGFLVSPHVGSMASINLGGAAADPVGAHNWRLCFLVPAVIAGGAAVLIFFLMPDTPPSVGLPEVEGTRKEGSSDNASQKEFKAFVARQVFGNRYIWILSSANFFVYAIRYAVFDWGATLLTEKHIKILHAAWMITGFEVFGLLGALLGGWITDKFLGGRAVRACVVYMALAGVSLFLFWKIQTQSELLITGLLCATGFFVYGPQCLLAIACANLATRRAAATAVGLTSIFGYASTVLSGWGLGKVVGENNNWDAGFRVLIGCAAVGTVLFICAWPAKADGYEKAAGNEH